MLDFSGAYSYSEVETIQLNNYSVEGPIVFPNPVKDVLNLEWSVFNKDGFRSVRLLSLDGRELLRKEADLGVRSRIKLSSLNLVSGVYLLEVRSGDLMQTRKVLVE